jgi:hypothetical protein
MKVNNREMAAILAGLRLLQVNSNRCSQDIVAILTGCGDYCALDDAAIDDLCIRITGGEAHPVTQHRHIIHRVMEISKSGDK